MKVKRFIERLQNPSGQALIETVLIITLISLAGITALASAGNGTSSRFSSIAQVLSGEDPEPESTLPPLGPIPDANNTVFYKADGTVTENPREASYCIAQYSSYDSRRIWGDDIAVPGVGNNWEEDVNGWENTEAVFNNTDLENRPGTIWEYCRLMREATAGYWYVPAAKELTDLYASVSSFRPQNGIFSSTQDRWDGTSAHVLYSSSINAAYHKTDKNNVVLFRDAVGIKPGIVDANVLSKLAWTQENAKTANAKYVEFLGKEWIVIGCNGSGVYSAPDTMTLLQANVEESTNWFVDNSTCIYRDSNLYKKLGTMWTGMQTEDAAVLVQPRKFVREAYSSSPPYSDGIDDQNASFYPPQALWPLSSAEAYKLHDVAGDSVCKASQNWWLRSPGQYSNNAAYVLSSGALCYGGTYPYNSYGIRPALRAQLNSLIISSGDGTSASPYVLEIKNNIHPWYS